jgi:hypothetical protein
VGQFKYLQGCGPDIRKASRPSGNRTGGRLPLLRNSRIAHQNQCFDITKLFRCANPVHGIVMVDMSWVRLDDEAPLHHVVDRIESTNRDLAKFWKNAHGWAPVEAAGLLGKSRLDWQVSLSSSLRLWLRDPPDTLSDGELILAWTNLGSLIEGTLKLFLSVYYNDFKKDVDNLKTAGAYDNKRQEPASPDGLTLDRLRKYVVASAIINADGDELLRLVQERRNAIHAFKDRPIGNAKEFQGALRSYLEMLEALDGRLPYP